MNDSTASIINFANRKSIFISWIICIFMDISLISNSFEEGSRWWVNAIYIILIQIPIILATIAYKKNNKNYFSGILTFLSSYLAWGIIFYRTENIEIYVFVLVISAIYCTYSDRRLVVILGVMALVLEVAKSIYDYNRLDNFNFSLYTTMIIASVSFYIIMYIVTNVIDSNISNSIENLRRVEEAKQKQDEIAAEIKKTIKVVSENSNEIDRIVEEISTSSESVAFAIEEISKGATTTAEDIQMQSSHLDKINSDIEESSKACDLMEKSSENAYTVIKQGEDILKELIEESNIVTDNTKEVYGIMKELLEESKEIADITGVISGIAGQTNLLALNASIEAARAGEAGKGFSVVANEVGLLADQCKEATKNIDSIVVKLQNKCNKSSEVVERLTISNGKQNSLVEETDTVFGKINNEISEIMNKNNLVKNSIDEVVKSSDIITASITSISAVSEETMSNSEETAAMSSEYIIHSNHARKLVGELVKVIEQLEKISN
ncbi:methyl-accepting chemotaxis sensory transducer [Clostridium bornimense]|uniref:Methyl-accepting chemotaxis sensory transducer n=1 Tax=Clostridium bornimense TaxID=1216932 RepID=W6S0A3_9CLOT|nr:methyl-accepting chemotaxis protein [Clostridium bornimense]CDM69289.1 methyl-accepting chemotaxis sensory transducer [Clostridium bornimense]